VVTNSDQPLNMAIFPYQLIESAINHVLIKESWATAKFLPYAGQVTRIDFSVFQMFLTVKPDGLLEVSAGSVVDPTVIITLPNDTPVKFASGDLSAVFATARISGSAELAEALAFVFRNIEWDVESDLADLIGDVAAARFVSFFKSFTNWHKTSAVNVAHNFKEYITEESRQVVSQVEIAAFSHSVNDLRNGLARLDKRISRLIC
jgi:ubiquinone biosynthesis protein UbiJ